MKEVELRLVSELMKNSRRSDGAARVFDSISLWRKM